MRVTSVDIGWRHLAYVDMTVGDSNLEIHEWKIVDIIEDSSININEATMEELIRLSAFKIGEVIKLWKSCKPEVVYLENQPLGQMARNIKTKTLSHVMQALLIAEGIPVVFVSPKKKLKDMQAQGSYSDNKKFAIAASSKLLDDCGLVTWKNWFDELGGKRDDLADALLQGYFSAKAALLKQQPKKKRAPTKKRKRDSHAETESALAGELI